MDRSSVESPCIGICSLTEQDTCAGCHRSRAEIKAWRGMTDAEKRAVNARVRRLMDDGDRRRTSA